MDHKKTLDQADVHDQFRGVSLKLFVSSYRENHKTQGSYGQDCYYQEHSPLDVGVIVIGGYKL